MSNATFAQRLDFKDIYPLIEARNFRDAVPRLKEFLQVERDHPSANFQLALIYEERMLSYHPIQQYRPAMKNAERAKMFFIKSISLIDEKEIKKNGKKFYTNFATVNDKGKLDVEFLTIKQKIDTSYKEIDRFLLLMPPVYEYFTKSVQFYSEATTSFAQICGQYASLKELYLLYDQDLENRFQKLQQDYDSTLYYFDAYLNATDKYPITEYKQSYMIKDVEHYRLDGLIIQRDFLAPMVEFWNYRAWVDDVKSMIVSDIAALRRQIIANEDRLNQNLVVLAKPSVAINSDLKIRNVDRDLILKLRNYDFNSFVAPLLLYKETKQQIQNRALKEFEMREDTSQQATYELILTYFSQMFNITLESDSLLHAVEQRMKSNATSRHQAYLDSYYNGREGLMQYINGEDQFVNNKLSEYSNEIKKTIVNNSSTFNDPTRLLRYRRVDIPMYVNLPDTLEIPADMLYTSHIIVTPDSSLYVGGILRSKSGDKNVEVFLAKTDSAKKVLWMNTYGLKDQGSQAVYDNFIGDMEQTPEGIAMVITSKNLETQVFTNTFKVILETGEEKTSVTMDKDAVARIIRYNEASNSCVIVFKGYTMKNNMYLTESVWLNRLDMEGSLFWEAKTELAGNVVDLVNINGGYLLVGNYTSIRNRSNDLRSLNPDMNETNVYGYKISIEGKLIDQRLFESRDPFYADRIVKVNDRNINLLGFSGNFKDNRMDYKSREQDVVHIITDANLKLLRANIDIRE